MTPRTSVFALHDSLTLKEAMEELLEKQFSRIPLYSGTIDNITGILNLKKVIRSLVDGELDVPLLKLSQKPLFVYETIYLDNLLEKLRMKRNHLAIVVDEFGGMAGIVTMEDLLEELVGEIYDEKDEVSDELRQIGDNRWLAKGRTDIADINKEIGTEIPLDEDYDTAQGFLMSQLETIPGIGDSLETGSQKYTVMRMQGHQIKLIMIESLERSELDSEKEK